MTVILFLNVEWSRWIRKCRRRLRWRRKCLMKYQITILDPLKKKKRLNIYILKTVGLFAVHFFLPYCMSMTTYSLLVIYWKYNNSFAVLIVYWSSIFVVCSSGKYKKRFYSTELRKWCVSGDYVFPLTSLTSNLNKSIGFSYRIPHPQLISFMCTYLFFK